LGVGHRLRGNQPLGRNGSSKEQPAIHSKTTRLETGVSEGVAPRLQKLVDDVWHVPPTPHVVNSEEWMRDLKCNRTWHREFQHCRSAILTQQIFTFVSQEKMGDMLIKFGSVRKIVIEAIHQTRTRQRQVNLPLASTGALTTSMLLQSFVQTAHHALPLRM